MLHFKQIIGKMNDTEDLTASMLGRVDISLQALSSIGFQRAQSSKIPKRLKQIVPSGFGRALRDAVVQGVTLLMKLNSFLKQINTQQQWSFIHIVITDGEDSGSRSTIEQTIQIMESIKKRITVANIQTVFVGLGLNIYQAQDLRLFTQYGNGKAQYYTVLPHDLPRFMEGLVNDTGIKRRALKLGIVNESQSDAFMASRVQQNRINIQYLNFAVLFNLSISGSMNGPKWVSVTDSVEWFRKLMGPTDIMATMAFDNKIKLLKSKKEEPNNNMVHANSSYNVQVSSRNIRQAPVINRQNVIVVQSVPQSNNSSRCARICCFLIFKIAVIIIVLVIATR